MKSFYIANNIVDMVGMSSWLMRIMEDSWSIYFD